MKWHGRQYEKVGWPKELPWADECLGRMSECERQMKLDDMDLSIGFVRALFRPEREVAPPPVAKKKSIFEGLM